MSFSQEGMHGVSEERAVSEAETPGWQTRALDRSLADARARSVERLSLFVAAARGLAEETGSSAFTVQQVVARSAQSLKSFYRYFGGKDDLLLALLEEDIAVGGLFQRALIDERDDPVDRLRQWFVALFALMGSGDQGYVSVLVREHQRLIEARPDEMEVAIAPIVDPLVEALARGQELGVVRGGDPRRDARLVFHLCLASILEIVSGRDTRAPVEVADDLWEFCWGGLHEPATSGGDD
jgi:AcrR family transcriptional regulator